MEESKKENDLNPLSNRVVNIAGATATVTIITLILYAFKIIPNEVSLAIGFFVSLPLLYSFIFGIIFDKPNFGSVFRHYSFTAYLLLALVIYMVVLRPNSIVEGFRYLLYFAFGLILAGIGYSLYALGYYLSSKKLEKYRWRALIGFGVSFIITFVIAFIFQMFQFFEII